MTTPANSWVLLSDENRFNLVPGQNFKEERGESFMGRIHHMDEFVSQQSTSRLNGSGQLLRSSAAFWPFGFAYSLITPLVMNVSHVRAPEDIS
jgi:hypothetical protein